MTAAQTPLSDARLDPKALEAAQLAYRNADYPGRALKDALSAYANALAARSVPQPDGIVRELYGDHPPTPRQMFVDAAHRMIEDATISGGDMTDPRVRSGELAQAFAEKIEAVAALATHPVTVAEGAIDKLSAPILWSEIRAVTGKMGDAIDFTGMEVQSAACQILRNRATLYRASPIQSEVGKP